MKLKVENDQIYSRKNVNKLRKNVCQKILQNSKKIFKTTSLLSGGLHQTLKKSTSMRQLCSVCSHNYAHIHIKPEMGQTKESVP